MSAKFSVCPVCGASIDWMQLKRDPIVCPNCGEALRVSTAYDTCMFLACLLLSIAVMYFVGARGVVFVLGVVVVFALLVSYGAVFIGIALAPPKLEAVDWKSILKKEGNRDE